MGYASIAAHYFDVSVVCKAEFSCSGKGCSCLSTPSMSAKRHQSELVPTVMPYRQDAVCAADFNPAIILGQPFSWRMNAQ